ncbi:hypothetical protein BH11BAC3_BH11BAC3_29510 [soil metagenome]
MVDETKKIMYKKANPRRQFLRQTLVAGAATIGLPGILSAAAGSMVNAQPQQNSEVQTPIDDDKKITILFQGDSITDGGRSKNNDWNHLMGSGYVYLLSSSLWYRFPGKNFQFVNRGVSGNKITDLAARWQQDCIDIQPDVLSILVGVNDANSVVDHRPGQVDSAKFEAEYRALLQQAKEKLPGVKLILGEPFIFQLGRTEKNYTLWLDEIKKRQASVRILAKEFDAILVDYQQAFDEALKRAPVNYWIWDGIHPMPAGHELMARHWTKRVHKKLSFIK